MKKTVGKIEILAPVGSYESLAAAIQGGADAVYFGVEQLNMRARSANNFSIDDMVEIVKRCHRKKIRAYLTVNTILYDHDIQLMRKVVTTAKEAGVDAIIASDFSVMQYAKNIEMPVHISTQANISNIETIEFFAPFADAVVLARELSLKQVEHISREIKRRKINGPSGKPIRIEVFAHGALCMAISGKCYLSLHSHFGSANRGACIQNCRRPYIVTDKEEGIQYEVDNEYIMSAKDLCTIDILDKILKTGATMLKIEGRGRSGDYVSTVTKCYREAVDAIKEGSYTQEKIELWKDELSKVYNRGFWEGYYLGRKLGEWTDKAGSSATEKKVYLGKGMNYYPKIQVGEFLIETGTVNAGDTLMLISPKTGVLKQQVNYFKVNGVGRGKAERGDRITFPLQVKVSKDDKLYKVLSSEYAEDHPLQA